MSAMCEVKEKQFGSLIVETRIYEDGYFQVTLMDDFGGEIESLDGNTEYASVALLEDYLIERHAN